MEGRAQRDVFAFPHAPLPLKSQMNAHLAEPSAGTSEIWDSFRKRFGNDDRPRDFQKGLECQGGFNGYGLW
jgi:hypothetical protein